MTYRVYLSLLEGAPSLADINKYVNNSNTKQNELRVIYKLHTEEKTIYSDQE